MFNLGPFGPDEAASPVALAVSGGGDSMALAYLARSWRTHIVALIVDHNLRTNSRQEAELTGQRLSRMGVPFRILTLAPLPAGGLQEQAREARFAILEQTCREIGASVLMLAHHQADQEETLFMRAEKKSGSEGMAGMALRSCRRGLTIMRPFLSLRPERLKETLRNAGVSWCEDPSNQNRRFRRVQLRQDMTESERRALCEIRERSVRYLERMEERASAIIAQDVTLQLEGWLTFSPAILAGVEPELADFLLGRLIRWIGGFPYLPTGEAIARLRERQEGSLGGVVLKKRFSGACLKEFILYREERGLPLSVPAKAGTIWDHRWLYQGPERPECQIAPLGAKSRDLRQGRDVPASVLKTVPALWQGGSLMAVPHKVRGLSSDVPRVPFLWQGGMKAIGAKRFS